jgi:hypothetical protein
LDNEDVAMYKLYELNKKIQDAESKKSWYEKRIKRVIRKWLFGKIWDKVEIRRRKNFNKYDVDKSDVIVYLIYEVMGGGICGIEGIVYLNAYKRELSHGLYSKDRIFSIEYEVMKYNETNSMFISQCKLKDCKYKYLFPADKLNHVLYKSQKTLN